VRFIKNLSWILTAEIISKVVGLITTIYIARILAPEGFGLFSFVMVVASYAAIPVNLGFNDYGILKIAPDRTNNNIRTIVSRILVIRVLLGGFAILILLIFSQIIPRLKEIQTLIFISSGIIILLAFNIEWLYIAIEELNIVAVVKIISSLMFLFCVLLFVNNREDITAIIALNVGRQFLIVLPLLLVFIYKFQKICMKFTKKEFIRFFKHLIPLGIAGLAAQMYYSMDLLMLGFLENSKNIGYYAASIKLIALGINFKLLLGQIIYPKVVRSINNSTDTFKQIATIIQKYSLILGAAVGILMFYLADDIINLIYGHDYNSAILPLKITVWVLALEIIGIVYPYAIISIDRVVYAKIILTISTINICLNLIFIPLFGIIGAAVAYLLASVMLMGITYLVMRKNLTGIAIKDAAITPLIAVIGLILIVEVLKSYSLHLSLLLGIVVFGIILYLRGITLKSLTIDFGIKS